MNFLFTGVRLRKLFQNIGAVFYIRIVEDERRMNGMIENEFFKLFPLNENE